MYDLKSIRNRPKLAAATHLCPQIRQDTRWNSIYEMLLKYKALVEATDHFLDVKGLSSATKLLILFNTGPDNEYDTLLEVMRELKLFADVTVAL